MTVPAPLPTSNLRTFPNPIGAMRRPFRSACLLTFFAATLAAGRAVALDEVIRTGGQPSIRGNVTKIDKAEITLEAAGKATTVPATDVAAVRWEGEPPQLNLTRSREANGDLAYAAKSYTELLGQLPADKPNLRTDVDFLIARTAAKQALSDPAQQAAAITSLDGFVKAHPDFFRHYEALQWLGRVQAASGDYAAAQATFGQLAAAPLPELKLAAQNAIGRIKLKQDDLPGALADFDAVAAAAADTPGAKREQFAARLGTATVLQRQSKHDEAIKTLDGVIADAAADDSAVQAEAFLRQGDSLQAEGKDKDALLSYLHVDLLFPGESQAHAEALYHLAKLWSAVGDADRSADARRRLTERYAGSEWAKKL